MEMNEYEFIDPKDKETLEKLRERFNTQIDTLLEKLNKKIKDLVVIRDLEDIAEELDYLTISRFNLMITKEYVNSDIAFVKIDLGDKSCRLALRKTTMEMLMICTDIGERIASEAFSGSLKYQYVSEFIKDPINYFNYIFFSSIEEVYFNQKGVLI